MHPKFDPTRVRTHDSTFHVTETLFVMAVNLRHVPKRLKDRAISLSYYTVNTNQNVSVFLPLYFHPLCIP